MNASRWTQTATERLDAERPGTVQLARVVSLAARIEPELIRAARVRLLPDLDPGVEADLWFSGLVQSRTPLAIDLRPDVLDELRTQLGADPALLLGAWSVLADIHRDVAVVVHLEERITFLSLVGDAASATEVDELLQSAVWSMVEQDRSGIARWAARAFERLPAWVRRSDSGQMLDVGSRARLGIRIATEDLPEDAGRWLPWVLPDARPVPVGVRLLEDGVELSDPSQVGAHSLLLPDTDPLIVEVSWPAESPVTTLRVNVPRPLTSHVVTTNAPSARLRTARGEVFELTPRPRSANSSVLALRGRVVTMDSANQVIDDGVVYVDGNTIVAVVPAKAPAPAAYRDVVVEQMGGTLYPGLIELHNHLGYNTLPRWQLSHRATPYAHRNIWAKDPEYRRHVVEPAQALRSRPETSAAMLRYAEAKCLAAGVTTSQGRPAGMGAPPVLRLADQHLDPDLPKATNRILALAAKDLPSFKEKLDSVRCFFLHLAEGQPGSLATREFTALRRGKAGWALGPALAAIHCTALSPKHFDIMSQFGVSLIWSPLHDYSLYGVTADVRAAREAGVRIGLGASWTVTGSKNLLAELKVARSASDVQDASITDHGLVAAVTRDAAAILGWDAALGSLEPGKRADILVLEGTRGSPYQQLLRASEVDVRLVVVEGTPRLGRSALMKQHARKAESRRVGGRDQLWNLPASAAGQGESLPSLSMAEEILREAMAALPALEPPSSEAPSAVQVPLDLDPLTVADDPVYYETLRQQTFIPSFVTDALP
jgi:5-methylthioadenosine/S-adenosylhomocysteine deaminase